MTKISDFIRESANVRKRVVLNGYAWWYDEQNGILYDSEEDNVGTHIKHVKLTAKEREQLRAHTLYESKNDNDEKLYSKTYGWYDSFKGRYYKSEEDAKKDISRVVTHNNSQFGKIFGNDDVADITSLFNFVGTTRGIKIVPKINKKRERHQIEYNTNEELVRKEKNLWEYGHGIEMGRHFSKLRYIKTSDKNIYGTEKTDEDNVQIYCRDQVRL